jgi:flagellar motor protein MotB
MSAHDIATDTHDESYFASFTDLLVGILFIFIIMLMLFASNMRNTEQTARDVTEQVTAMIESRNIVLQEIKKSLKELGIEVEVDEEQGILRLPDKILFDRGRYELSADGNEALIKLAGVLRTYLPCLARVKNDTLKEACAKLSLKSQEALETVLIEGHTDRTGAETGFDNWTLSANRAINVFRGLTAAQPVLDDDILNMQNVPVLAVSGYEARRPIVKKNDAAQNRRIDLRFIMRSPTPEDVERIKRAVAEH